MARKIIGPYIDHSGNIIAIVINDHQTVNFYQKTHDTDFELMETPENIQNLNKPYILFNPNQRGYEEPFNAFYLHDGHFYQSNLVYTIDYFGSSQNPLMTRKMFKNDSQLIINLAEIGKRKERWNIPENIPAHDDLENMIFRPVVHQASATSELDTSAASVPNTIPELSIDERGMQAIAEVQSNLPQEVEEALKNEFLASLDYLEPLNSEDIVNEINILLGLEVSTGDEALRPHFLNEYWFSYRFIEYPELQLSECQNYLFKLYMNVANSFRDDDPVKFYSRTLSQHTVRSFLLKNDPARPLNAQFDTYYVERISAIEADQNNKIDNFQDYPQGTNKQHLKQLLAEMRSDPQNVIAHGNNQSYFNSYSDFFYNLDDDLYGYEQTNSPQNHSSNNGPQANNNQAPVQDEAQAFMEIYNPIFAYWAPANYNNFTFGFIWQICDAVMRFLTYLDIYALRLSQTAQLISSYEGLNAENRLFIGIAIELNDSSFETHIANRVFG